MGHQGIISDLKWSPIDDRLASSDGSGVIRIWNAAPSTAWRLYPPLAERGGVWSIQGADWSSDGRYLVLAGGDVVNFTEPASFEIWDVYANRLIMQNLGDALNLMGLWAFFSPDDQTILYTGLKGFPDFSALATAYVFDAESGQIIRSFTPDDETVTRSVAWSPDGSQVATGMFYYGPLANEIVIWDYQTGEQVARLVHSKTENMGISWVEWSPDGSKFVSASDDSTAKVWDAHTWELLFTLQHEEPAYINVASWSPDGTRLLTGGGNEEGGAKDNTARVWDGETGKELLVFNGHTKSVGPGSWSLNGERIATFSNDGTVRVWDASTGDELLTISIPVLYGGLALWSPDGQHLAIVGLDMLISVWRVWQTKEELVDYARECCVFRDLTDAERQQFGLPER